MLNISQAGGVAALTPLKALPTLERSGAAPSATQVTSLLLAPYFST